MTALLRRNDGPPTVIARPKAVAIHAGLARDGGLPRFARNDGVLACVPGISIGWLAGDTLCLERGVVHFTPGLPRQNNKNHARQHRHQQHH